MKTTFDKYGQYDFDDPATQFWFNSQTVFEGNLSTARARLWSPFSPDDELQA
ncbi:MAG: hypothetical protein U5L72_17780 [Bacteroidales bacterium]|nr:hypothetical protein [Bacteroidales bacterium]